MAGTGANSIPLGQLHPIFSQNKPQLSGESSMLSAAREAAARVTANIKRDHSQIGGAKKGPGPESTNWPQEKRRKKSRWGADEGRATAAVIPANLSKEQEHQVLMHLQIEDITRKLRSGDLGIPPNPEDRSPSPEPVYNHEGKRLNTREYRTRKKLEEERHLKIQEALASNPDYKPPADYKPPVQRVNDRVMIPQDEHPDINFVGLLIGPRGNTLKKLEKETGTKIMIRGKGSVKEGKVGRKDGQPLPGEDEPLHALVTASSAEAVKKAVDQIRDIIKQGIETPEGQNDLRRMQLRELARLNGTLRDEDTVRCSNCGATAHRTWQCPEKQNVTSNVLCTLCGGAGHIAQDCRGKGPGARPAANTPTNTVDKAKMDSEYLSLMAELGEGPPPSAQSKMGGSNNNNSSPFQNQPPPPGPRPLLSRPPHPPPLMGPGGHGGPVPPPWMKDKPPSLLGRPPGPPPPHGHGHGGPPPPNMHGGPGNQMNHHNHHPPPPPPSLMSQMVPPPMNMPHMPPPPFGGGNMPPPWAMPPPPPVSQPTSSASSSSPGLSPVPPPPSLLAAPPPPPPPSSEPPPPLPTSAPWQTQTSSTGSGANTAGSVNVVTTSSPQQPLPWQLNTGSSSATSTSTTTSSVPPWQVASPSATATSTSMSAAAAAASLSVPPPPPQWAPPPGPPGMMHHMGLPPPMPPLGVPPPSFQPPMPQGPPPPMPFNQPPPPMDMGGMRPPVPPLVGAPPPPPPPSS